MPDEPVTRRSLRASAETPAPPRITARGPQLSTLLATAVVLAWAGIVGPGLFIPDLHSPAPLVWWPASLGYLGFFFRMRPALITPRTGRYQVAAMAMAACGGIATLSGASAGLSPVFLCATTAMIGFVVPPRTVAIVVVLEWLVLAVAVIRGTELWAWAGAFAGMIAFAALAIEIAVREFDARRLVARTMADLEKAHGRLAAAHVLLSERSRSDERLRIARDLHDAIGHQLTALSLNLEVASHFAEGPIVEPVSKSRELAREVLTDIRGVVSALRDPSADMVAELGRLAQVIVSPRTTVEVDPAVEHVAPEVRQVVFRVVQEAVTNAVRHSAGARAWVNVRVREGSVYITVRDDGVGISQLEPGNGLAGMRERVESIGGELEWDSAPDQGFTLRARVPTAR